jgi:nucleoside-diphosphate-sugar epimerase
MPIIVRPFCPSVWGNLFDFWILSAFPMTHRVLITGAAGYVGGMLCELFSQRADVDRIIALDTKPLPEALRSDQKIRWIVANTADTSWQERAGAERPDVVVHAAWQIREQYGQSGLQRTWNVGGSENVFAFAFATPSVRRLVHFSTVSSYGAQADNRVEQSFTERAPLRPSDLRYAEEKRLVEADLTRRFAEARERETPLAVAVIRPVAITGPRGRRRGGVSLQSALSGEVAGRRAHWLVSPLLSFIPVTATCCRQFIHEDDIADICARLAFGELKTRYDVFNASPPGAVLGGADLARVFHKRALHLHPQLVRLAFFLAWHATRGRIPTPRGSWKSFSYPLAVDGAKLTAMYGYRYRTGSLEAFTQDTGRYAASSQADVAVRGGGAPRAMIQANPTR